MATTSLSFLLHTLSSALVRFTFSSSRSLSGKVLNIIISVKGVKLLVAFDRRWEILFILPAADRLVVGYLSHNTGRPLRLNI
jgi:hypothetical protein